MLLLSKSDFVRGYDCERRVWLDKFRPDLKPELSLAARDRMETGRRIGEFARARYPEGVFPESGRGDPYVSAENTQIAMDQGHSCLFEAAFLAGDLFARVDVLSKSSSTGWTIDEVKSSTLKEPKKIAEDKVLDLAFQVHTAKRAGLAVERARLVLIDGQYRWDGQPYDHLTMLGEVDLAGQCAELEETVAQRAGELLRILGTEGQPEVEINTHCKKCDYANFCLEERSEHDVIHLPDIRVKGVRDLRADGYETIDQIPEDHKVLTNSRRRMRTAILTGEPYISEGLKEALDAIPFPAAFIDYESSNPAFPMYVGTRPYQQVCFQWSTHVMQAPDSEPIHSEFLACDTADPRAEFCATLWKVVEPCRAIVHYTRFEITQLRAMVEDGIPLAAELFEAIETRSVDLEKVVSEHVYLTEFNGRTSIKVVLPALVPGMSYKDMLIADGTAAAAGFRKMVDSNTYKEEATEIRTALLEYCKQDTLAMVKIYRALKDIRMRRRRSITKLTNCEGSVPRQPL